MSEEQYILSIYYKKIYPTEKIFNFLQNKQNREFSVTLTNNIYMRYRSFPNYQELQKFLDEKSPEKIDFGAVYTTRPQSGGEMIPLEKELVFDIDLTDYYRKCCEGKNICDKCFVIIRCAAKIMDKILRDYFGYSKILYVFSGGRGLHIWVCDHEAMMLNNRERKSIISCINKKNKKLVLAVMDIMREYSFYFNLQGIKDEINDQSLSEHLFVKLDENVTKDIKHLLKGPFSVHPSSKRISVPISIEKIDTIKIEELPKLVDVMEDISILKKYIIFFEKFVQKL